MATAAYYKEEEGSTLCMLQQRGAYAKAEA